MQCVFDFWILNLTNIESWFSQNKSKLFSKQSKNSVFLISINLQLSIPALFCIRHRSKRAMSAFEVSNFLFTLWNRWTKSCENCQIFEWSNSRGELRYFPHSDVMFCIFFRNSTCKDWVFWEGHKIWKKSSSYHWQERRVLCKQQHTCQKVDEDFSKQMWSSRIIQNLS